MPLDDDTARLAAGPTFATVVTLMPDGQPQAQLRWVDTDGDHVLVNTEPQRQVAKNIARDPRITVLLRNEEDPYDWSEVRGRVVATTEGEEALAHIHALSRKYTGADYQNPIGPEGRVILSVEASKVITPATLYAGSHSSS